MENKKFIAIGSLSQEEVDELVEIFLRAVRRGQMTLDEMLIIGERESWFTINPNYKEESKTK